MSHITIRFIGLAMHLSQAEVPKLGPKHRVILLGFDGGDLHERHVNSHHPRMIFPDKTKVPLGRVRLRVLNPKPAGFREHDSFRERVPHLDRSHDLTPKDSVFYEGDPPVAAYFDTDHGQLHACLATEAGAIGTSLKIETEGEPILEATGLHSDETQQWTLRDGDVVDIYNVSDDIRDEGPHIGDSGDDYLINYLAFDQTSFRPEMPPEPREAALIRSCFETEPPRIFLELTSSCSNTNFP